MQVRRMRADEREAVLDLLERAFGLRSIFASYMDHDPAFRPDDFVLATEADRPVSCVQIFTKTIRVRGEAVGLGGIGSVATHPDARRRGLATALLRVAIDDMRARGMALSLLFGVERIYDALGWVRIPLPWIAIHRPEHVGAAAPGLRTRAYTGADFEAVRALYDDYSGRLELTTVRDEDYWRGQLRYAGNPDEVFRVAERAGRIVSYLRTAQMRAPVALEYAFAGDHADALLALFADALPGGKALLAPAGPDGELEKLLLGAGARVDRAPYSGSMWRVLDRARLRGLAELPDAADDASILRALVESPRALYWQSDRF
jgi:predicted N-acetyltransferase YhbS